MSLIEVIHAGTIELAESVNGKKRAHMSCNELRAAS